MTEPPGPIKKSEELAEYWRLRYMALHRRVMRGVESMIVDVTRIESDHPEPPVGSDIYTAGMTNTTWHHQPDGWWCLVGGGKRRNFFLVTHSTPSGGHDDHLHHRPLRPPHRR